MKILIKLDRLAAWVLLIVIITYGITGYGMTKGLINDDLARSLHLGWLGAIGIVAFTIHTSWGIHLACRRRGIWNRYTKVGLVAFYTLLVLFFGYMNFFYQTKKNQQNIPATTTIKTVSETSTTLPTTSSTIFTSSTLKNYNGLNETPSYVAVDGIVYDMSKIFKNGSHQGYKAGQDLSTAFHDQHPETFLNGLPIVGTYSE
jgi:predicted heme/steroid binding protein